jgi:hypothetical protein
LVGLVANKEPTFFYYEMLHALYFKGLRLYRRPFSPWSYIAQVLTQARRGIKNFPIPVSSQSLFTGGE